MLQQSGSYSYNVELTFTIDPIKDMCAFWNIKYETFSRRIKVYNMSLEEALTKPVKHNGGIVCYDHLGEKYYSVTSMCEHWGIARKLYEYRISHGWSQEKALTTPPRCQNKQPARD